MSRIGKLPVAVASGLKVALAGQQITVTGAKGTLKLELPREVAVSQEGNFVHVKPANDSNRARAMWGLSRTLVNNMMIGASQGYTVELEMNGVGYKAAVQGQKLTLSLGFSHEVIYNIPQGITITAPKPTQLVITGADKQKVGQVAAEIRKFRKPEPYKGKGIKYSDEKIRRKEGKKK